MAKVAEIVARYPAVTVEELLAGNPESTWSDPTHEMVGHLTRNAAEALGYPPQPIVSLGGTDTRFWRRAGVPCFVYGCSPAGMGGIDEAVSIAEFRHVMRTHALAAFDYLTAGR
jgi:succinyl-diaminopimelate desuccinylase